MKNLIEEIEKNKSYYQTDISCEFNDGWNNALDKAIKILNQYNIITAPKSIKLSEIVENLEDIKEHYHISSVVYDKEFKGLFNSEDYYPAIVEFNKDLSFKAINLPINDNTKWLYTLWIANVEIVDDMECDE